MHLKNSSINLAPWLCFMNAVGFRGFWFLERGTAFLLGAHDSYFENLVGSRIGDTHLRLDVHWGALGVVIVPGDRWRRSHGAANDRIFVDGRTLGNDIQSKVCGIITHHHSAGGRTAYEKLCRRLRCLQTIVPDLTTTNLLEVLSFKPRDSRCPSSSAYSRFKPPAAPRGCQLNQIATAAHADEALSSELRTAESPRYLKNTGPKPGKQMPNSWEAEAGASPTRWMLCQR